MSIVSAITDRLILEITCPKGLVGAYGITALAAERRALPNAPNGYTPMQGGCSNNRPTIRNATGLSSNETSWLELRRNNTIGPLHDLLGRLNITNFDSSSYLDGVVRN